MIQVDMANNIYRVRDSTIFPNRIDLKSVSAISIRTVDEVYVNPLQGCSLYGIVGFIGNVSKFGLLLGDRGLPIHQGRLLSHGGSLVNYRLGLGLRLLQRAIHYYPLPSHLIESSPEHMVLVKQNGERQDASAHQYSIETKLELAISILASFLFSLLSHKLLGIGLEQVGTARTLSHLLLALLCFAIAGFAGFAY
jgi:hypothetical protein